MAKHNLLLELGTEELPPKALRKLGQALCDNMTGRLKDAQILFDSCKWYATPRRLALFVTSLEDKQQDRTIELKGPSVKAAYDAEGKPTKAALGWCQANGVDINDVQTLKTDKGEWLYLKTLKQGAPSVTLIPGLFKESLASLPIPKLMHWGDKREEFVRPVHTLCMLYGDALIEGQILGVKSSKTIKGHRFVGSQEVTLNNADEYLQVLRQRGMVIADYDERKAMIAKQVNDLAASAGGEADLDDSLLEEVASLVEHPYVFLAKFEESFLQVPSEALVYTMKGDQKYFPIYKDGKLLPVFAFVSNINPEDPTNLISGNERVVRPRLSDAQFFFNTDRKHSLEHFHKALESIVYQKDIGTIAYRSEIVAKTAAYLADKLGADPALCRRAAYLAKCDLATTLVTEFTDTQGIMGMHYAKLDGEDPNVSEAIFEQYLPRFAGDKIPIKPVQMCVSIAEKLVSLTGIFGINQLPKGDKDPYALRRAAIGLIRIVLENKLDFNLVDAIEFTNQTLGDKVVVKENVHNVSDFVFNRLKAYYQEKGIGAEIFLAVLANHPVNLLDFDKRVMAVRSFKDLPEAQDLAAAYKRVANILSKSQGGSDNIDKSLLTDPEEIALVEHLEAIMPAISDCYAQGNYAKALSTLAEMKKDVDNFFDKVMVNAEDPALRANRLSILLAMSQIFSKTADISILY